MKTTKASQQNRFLRIMTIPIRALGKARDFYVRSMSSCGTRIGYGGAGGMPSANYMGNLPRSFSVNSSISDDNDDFRELIKVASTRSLAGRLDLNNLYSLQQQTMPSSLKGMPPRSCSVGMGRIDEEKPYVLGEEKMNTMNQSEAIFPRSKSHAVNRRTSALF
ncbi:hypothetical protein ACH5RR_034946 [Cinchona calisaya]|uniref:Uncharacterized protein n=1 Tax=Cinchona calisaya TaxID=153742 RepID=A0ABD2YGV6_9GENT